MWNYIYPNELYHHGIKGQKWGVRRFQNKDGSLTNKGKKRYLDKVSDYINKKIEQDKANQQMERARRRGSEAVRRLEEKRARDLRKQQISEIKQSKGVIKGAKMLSLVLKTITADSVPSSRKQPWDEKHRGRQGGYI